MRIPPLFVVLILISTTRVSADVSPEYQAAKQARISGNYAVVILADGSKAMVPLAKLSAEDRTWLDQLSQQKPAAAGKGTVVVVAAEPSATAGIRKTLVTSSVEGPVETVQLCPPNLMRDQIGGTCMLYARIHWLDIAGYYTPTPDIYKIINLAPSSSPWMAPVYVSGLTSVFTAHTPHPIRHRPSPELDPFDWARSELRKGRPLLAAFPREIWQALPPGFIAAHPWNGGNVGHQIVINGFTWNRETRSGSFHIINSWAELPEFDLTTEAAGGGAMVIEESLSPRGEKIAPATADREVVTAIRFIKRVGAVNLYEVDTNRGTRRMAAATEEAVRDLVEKP